VCDHLCAYVCVCVRVCVYVCVCFRLAHSKHCKLIHHVQVRSLQSISKLALLSLFSSLCLSLSLSLSLSLPPCLSVCLCLSLSLSVCLSLSLCLPLFVSVLSVLSPNLFGRSLCLSVSYYHRNVFVMCMYVCVCVCVCVCVGSASLFTNKHAFNNVNRVSFLVIL